MTPISATGRSTEAGVTRRPRLRPALCILHATGTRPGGFSLLEVLVVVFIVGILATMFTLSVGVTGGDRQLDTETDRLIAVIRLANEEAVIQGREIGLRFSADGYRFAAYQEDFVDYPDEETPDLSDWVALEASTLLGPRRLPNGLLFELSIDGREVVLNRFDEEDTTSAGTGDNGETLGEDNGLTDPADFAPQVMIYSSGDMDPFSIQLRREFSNTGTIIEFDIDGSSETEKAAL